MEFLGRPVGLRPFHAWICGCAAEGHALLAAAVGGSDPRAGDGAGDIGFLSRIACGWDPSPS